MPTGYTANIKDGISFEKFIMNCARAMGACVTMRDDPHDKEIPERFEPSNYHHENIGKANSRIEEINAMGIIVATERATKEYNGALAEKEKDLRENNAQREAYKVMLRKVEAWSPPTTDHTGLKDFMISQINDSIKFDDTSEYVLKREIKLLTGQEWKEKEIAKALKDLDYHFKENAKEVSRVEGRNQWIKALRESF